MFITFEGGNGAGKSTQIALLQNALKDEGYNVVITREPGGSEIAEKLRTFLRDNPGMDKMTELLLLFAARNEHYLTLIQPALRDENNIVLCDRFYDSSLVFQGILNGISIESILQLKQMVLGGFEPDLTIILDLDYKSALRRITQRGQMNDKYDTLDEEKFNLIRNAYLKIADLFDRCCVIKASRPASRIASDVLKTVLAKYEFNYKSAC